MYKVRTQDSVGKVLIHDVTKIVSDGNGLVALNDTKLAAGEYYFEEVATLKNFEIC